MFLSCFVGRSGNSPDLEWLGVLTLRACWRYYIEPYSLCFIHLVLSPLVQFYRVFLPVKEGGLHYFSTTRAVGQTLRAGHSLLYPCFSNISPSLLGALPSYVTGGSDAFVCNGLFHPWSVTRASVAGLLIPPDASWGTPR